MVASRVVVRGFVSAPGRARSGATAVLDGAFSDADGRSVTSTPSGVEARGTDLAARGTREEPGPSGGSERAETGPRFGAVAVEVTGAGAATATGSGTGPATGGAGTGGATIGCSGGAGAGGVGAGAGGATGAGGGGAASRGGSRDSGST
jgi:hypothetical protein